MRPLNAECWPLNAGFTLVEMAMVLVIMGLVMLTVFPALRAVQDANARSLTQSNLRSLMNATAAYVQANGCLPCPANPAYGGALFGLVGYGNTTTACGGCNTAPEGIPPFASLGLPMSTAKDGWGHWFSMRVDPALTINFAVAPPDTPCTQADVNAGTCSAIGAMSKGMCKTGLSKTNTVRVTVPGGATQNEAVIFVSYGKDGYWSLFAQPVANANNGAQIKPPGTYTTCAAGGYAACNGAESVAFVDAPQAGGTTNPYDDQLLYADRNSVVAWLGNPACSTVW